MIYSTSNERIRKGNDLVIFLMTNLNVVVSDFFLFVRYSFEIMKSDQKIVLALVS